MQSRGNAPSAEQKRFRENLRDLYPGSVIHHAVGGTAKVKINLVSTNIGEWWILAVAEEEHKKIHASSVGQARKLYEKELFEYQMKHYFRVYFRMPVPDEVLEAIEDYHL